MSMPLRKRLKLTLMGWLVRAIHRRYHVPERDGPQNHCPDCRQD